MPVGVFYRGQGSLNKGRLKLCFGGDRQFLGLNQSINYFPVKSDMMDRAGECGFPGRGAFLRRANKFVKFQNGLRLANRYRAAFQQVLPEHVTLKFKGFKDGAHRDIVERAGKMIKQVLPHS
jgi:hypothetical protein